MNYSTFVPSFDLQEIVECYWTVEGNEKDWQKITPDGYTECIFHFGDAYKVKSSLLSKQLQPRLILAGQIDRPLYLQASGVSNILGIKFASTGLWKMFGISLATFTNQTTDLSMVLPSFKTAFKEMGNLTTDRRIQYIETFLRKYLADAKGSELDPVIKEIKAQNGQVSIVEVSEARGISARKLERLFREHVGVSAKLYSRILRFATIYKMLQNPRLSKVQCSYLMGYFDQSHFNKEFKQFAGESPEVYFKNNHAFSNFFLSR